VGVSSGSRARCCPLLVCDDVKVPSQETKVEGTDIKIKELKGGIARCQEAGPKREKQRDTGLSPRGEETHNGEDVFSE
jgi:hypothetical protein